MNTNLIPYVEVPEVDRQTAKLINKISGGFLVLSVLAMPVFLAVVKWFA